LREYTDEAKLEIIKITEYQCFSALRQIYESSDIDKLTRTTMSFEERMLYFKAYQIEETEVMKEFRERLTKRIRELTNNATDKQIINQIITYCAMHQKKVPKGITKIIKGDVL